ncbi:MULTISPECIES: hypothetical protein [unclassified Microcoleus]|uniref:hypothetical protein n=1 Tax=unclassified Microcoleus TaxID=2642155 RepID=UPI002FD20DC6
MSSTIYTKLDELTLCTKTEDYNAVGKMIGAKDWVKDENPADNPKVVYDQSGPVDKKFQEVDRGVSISVRFGKNTYPSDLKWIPTNNASSWMKILRVKTALGG